MHLMWSKHSTRLIQISWPPKSIERGHCLISPCIFSHTSSYSLLRQFVLESLLFFTLQVSVGLSTSLNPPLLLSLPSPALCPPLLSPKPKSLSWPPAAR